jgi:hypothetical protein
MITVIDVIRSMGVEPTPDLTWSVGSIVRGIYKQRCGELPQKDLRRKTDRSGGTHCFAVYPEAMRADIERVVKSHTVEASRQLDLFR